MGDKVGRIARVLHEHFREFLTPGDSFDDTEVLWRDVVQTVLEAAETERPITPILERLHPH